MCNRIKQLFISSSFPLLLALLVGVIAYREYIPGTYLTGWDTLHPEFDFGLNFQRMFDGVWREEQGLGALAGHSHMSDLPRVIILWLLHFIFPLNALKYFYIFACLFLGPLGMYYLIKEILPPRDNSKNNIIAFLSGAFYLLNLGTVQQFFVPFEMFTTQYAFLPWIILFSLKYLYGNSKEMLKRVQHDNKSTTNLLYFAVVTLLATPQSYAAHLWYPFIGVYGLFLATYTVLSYSKATLKKSLLLLIVTLVMNAYWLLPNLYFITTSSYVPKESKQNRIFSQEYRLRNRANGYLPDVSLLKGFYLDWSIYDFGKQNFTELMPEWHTHLEKPLISFIGYLFFISSLSGLLYSIMRKNREYLPLTPFFIVPFIFLMNHTPPFEQFFDFLLRFSISEEALRFVFTKFSILLTFSYAVFFSLFLSALLKKVKNIYFLTIIAGCIFYALMLYSFPLFKGQLISDKVQVPIPQQYFDFWSYMKTQPDGKAMSLPLHTFSGWQYYDWGYQGSGFIWFGLKQSILDRDSDRWSISNEQAFRELQYSLYARNETYFFETLKKYEMNYIIWDKSVIHPDVKNRQQILFKRETTEIINHLLASNKLVKLKSFKDIDIYKINIRNNHIITDAPYVGPISRWSYFDYAYDKLGNYISDGRTDIYYPFRDIIDKNDKVFTNRLQIDPTNNNYFLSAGSPDQELILPDYVKTEKVIYATLYIQKDMRSGLYTLLFKFLLPKNIFKPIEYKTQLINVGGRIPLTLNNRSFIFESYLSQNKDPLYLGEVFIRTDGENYLNSKRIELTLEKTGYELSDPASIFAKFPLEKLNYSAEKIAELNKNASDITLKKGDPQSTLIFKTKTYQKGVYINLPDLSHDIGYIITFKSRNITGLPLRICFKNQYSNLCSLYDELSRTDHFKQDYFFIPPSDNAQAYGLAIDNISFGNYESHNELQELTILPFPINFLSQIYYIKNPSHISSTQTFITNEQSTHQGWKAYQIDCNGYHILCVTKTKLPFLFGTELKTKVLINNWANGWQLHNYTNQNKIIFLFWPQYLEYAGFALIIGALSILVCKLFRRVKA